MGDRSGWVTGRSKALFGRIRPGFGVSTFRVGTCPSEPWEPGASVAISGHPAEPVSESKLAPPDLETLIERDAAGGCEQLAPVITAVPSLDSMPELRFRLPHDPGQCTRSELPWPKNGQTQKSRAVARDFT